MPFSLDKNIVLSSSNSRTSTTGLGTGSSFTGTAEDVSTYSHISIYIECDQHTETDGLQIRFGSTPGGLSDIENFQLEGKPFHYFTSVKNDYFQIIITNAYNATMRLRVFTYLHTHPPIEKYNKHHQLMITDPKFDLAQRKTAGWYHRRLSFRKQMTSGNIEAWRAEPEASYFWLTSSAAVTLVSTSATDKHDTTGARYTTVTLLDDSYREIKNDVKMEGTTESYISWFHVTSSTSQVTFENAYVGTSSSYNLATFSSIASGYVWANTPGTETSKGTITLQMPAKSNFSSFGQGDYFILYSYDNLYGIYVWFNTAYNYDPFTFISGTKYGYSSIEVDISGDVTGADVAASVLAACAHTVQSNQNINVLRINDYYISQYGEANRESSVGNITFTEKTASNTVGFIPATDSVSSYNNITLGNYNSLIYTVPTSKEAYISDVNFSSSSVTAGFSIQKRKAPSASIYYGWELLDELHTSSQGGTVSKIYEYPIKLDAQDDVRVIVWLSTGGIEVSGSLGLTIEE